MIEVFIDSREQNEEIKKILGKALDLTETTLSMGDLIIGNVVLERKTVFDLYNSIKDNRLEKQMRDFKFLREDGVDARLLIEGDLNLLINGSKKLRFTPKMKWAYLRKILTTIEFGYGIPLVRTNNPKDTANLIISISKYGMDKDKTAISIVRKSVRKELDIKEKQIYILTSFKGIGSTTAEQLINENSTLIGAFNAISLGKVENFTKTKKALKQAQELLNNAS